jgi:hypothetical protein
MTIGHFDLPMQWESESAPQDGASVYEWLTARPGPSAGPEAASVEAAGTGTFVTEDITMEPTVITVSAARREALLRQAGWTKISLQFYVTDFNETPMDSHTCFVQYLGPTGEENNARSDLRGGNATFGNFWAKPVGMLRFLAIPPERLATSEVMLDGTVPVPADIRGGYLAFRAAQQYREVQVRASTKEEVTEKMQVQGSVKFSILKVVEIGGGGGYDRTKGQTTADELAWTVRVGTNAVTITRMR